MAPLELAAFEESDRFMFPEELEAYRQFRVPKDAGYRLTSSLDSMFLLRRDLSLLAESEVKALHGLTDLPSHAILDRGQIVGLWEFDPGDGTIAWTSFVPANKMLKQAVAQTERYVREQLGDARSFSLDSPKSRAPRIAALRKARA